MNRKGIIVLIVILVTITIGSLIIINLREDYRENNISVQSNQTEESKEEKNSPYITIFMGWLPFFIIIITTMEPSYPVTSSLGILKSHRYRRDNKRHRLKRFASREYLESNQFEKLLEIKPYGYRKIKVQKASKDIAYVWIRLQGGFQYIFQVRKRNRAIDPKGSSAWVIVSYKENVKL